MTTTKYVYDRNSRRKLRVVGEVRPWEELSPGVRVRRRVVSPHPSTFCEPIAWFATFDDEDVELFR